MTRFAVPTSMRRVVATVPGPPEVMRVETCPTPRPGPGEVLIRVAAAGINRADLIQREGRYNFTPGVPDILGLEVSGQVVDSGEGVDEWPIGSFVCALVYGGYSEYCVAPAGQCMPIVRGLSLVEAAALPEATMTVWPNMVDLGRLREGDCCLIHGGTSGIGSTAIQIAKALGVRVFTTASGPEKTAACRRFGADYAIDYKSEDFVEVCRRLTDGRGVDLILDIVGASYFARNIDLLRMDGRLICISFISGSTMTANFHHVMRKRLTITGSSLRPRTVEEKRTIAANIRRHVLPMIESGRLRPVIDRTFPMSEAPAAHRRLQDFGNIGKIMLIIDDKAVADYANGRGAAA